MHLIYIHWFILDLIFNLIFNLNFNLHALIQLVKTRAVNSDASRGTEIGSDSALYRLNAEGGGTCILMKVDALVGFKYKTKLGEDIVRLVFYINFFVKKQILKWILFHLLLLLFLFRKPIHSFQINRLLMGTAAMKINKRWFSNGKISFW